MVASVNMPQDHCYGIDVGADAVVVAEDVDGRPRVVGHYRPDNAGLAALKQHISAAQSHRRICIRSYGALAVSVGLALIAVPGAEVMFVAPRALQAGGGIRSTPPLATAEQRAEHLAVVAKRMV